MSVSGTRFVMRSCRRTATKKKKKQKFMTEVMMRSWQQKITARIGVIVAVYQFPGPEICPPPRDMCPLIKEVGV